MVTSDELTNKAMNVSTTTAYKMIYFLQKQTEDSRAKEYVPPTQVQFHIRSQEDLNLCNRSKLERIVASGYTREDVMHDVVLIDTSVLDDLLRADSFAKN